MTILQSIITLLIISSFIFPIYGQTNLSQKENQTRTDEEKFLERFVGSWIGEGESDGKKVRDEMKFEWALGKRFLKLSYRALEGDSYEGEGYIWFNKEQNQYEYYEFNNGRWAVRQGIGKVVNNSFIVSNTFAKKIFENLR